MFEPEKIHDVSELAKLSDDELDRMGSDGELSYADLVSARLQKYLNDPKSAPEPVQAGNDGWNDYTTACLKQIFPE